MANKVIEMQVDKRLRGKKVGDVFEATEGEARFYEITKLAHRIDSKSKVSVEKKLEQRKLEPHEYRTRELEPEKVSTPTTTEGAEAKRRYRRRDMTPEKP